MRVRLELPETVLYQYEISVRVTDINYAGHVGNDRFLIYAQEARSAWIESLGYKEWEIEGCHTILADAAIQFMNEAFASESLVITVLLGDQHKYGIDLYYSVTRAGDEIARMKTAMLFRSEETQQLSAPPSQFINKF